MAGKKIVCLGIISQPETFANMTTNIKIASDVLNKPSDSQHVQFLPCTIVSGGTTDVEERFNRFTEKDEKSGTLTNSLRDFPLDGNVVSLPEGYTGLILEGTKAGLTSQDRDVRATTSFKEMTYWNYDRVPGEGDAYQQAMQWANVAKVLHSD